MALPGLPGAEKAPIYFGSAGRPLFGVYNPPAGSTQAALGVVLCNPIGDDLIRAHRAFRHLAEGLAAAGFPVLRFDFDGTGDSGGDERDPALVAAWRGDVGRAVAALRAQSGVASVCVLGLRFGGTLAALAAEELGDIDALVLWGAYQTSDAFVSEITKAHKIQTMLEPASFSGGPVVADGKEALGFHLTSRLIEELKGLDLFAIKRSPARRTLVLDTANLSSADAIVKHLSGLGSVVTSRHMPGQKFLITRPQDSEVPQATIDAIVTWLKEDAPAAAASSAPRAAGAASAESSILRERAVIFGGARRLFGILTAPPPDAARPDLPAIIMLSAGTVHRIGPHRMYVAMARRWAALGFHVLRVDLSGIGDSPAAPGSVENVTYPRESVGDVQAAMDFLSETLRASKFILTGLCSGGDITFQIGFRHPRVAGAIMINPRTFCVNDLGMVDSYQQARWYESSLLRPDSIKRLLKGDVGLARAALIVAPKVKDQVVNRARRAMSSLLGGGHANEAATNKPRENDVPKCLRQMAERGVDTYLVVTEHDPGVDYVDENYGREMRELASVPGFSRIDVKGTDHTFTALWAQELVSTAITEHLKRRFLAARAA
jgi:pimeloyl-ACP methyl ester carboxylesterase